MPRRKKPTLKALARDSKGRFIRNLGWVKSPATGKYTQRKFYLGHDEDDAKHASARLEVLWQCVERRFARNDLYDSLIETAYHALERDNNQLQSVFRIKPRNCRATWCPVSLSIAEAIRNGQPVAKVSTEHVPAPVSPDRTKDWLFKTRQDFNVIHIEFDDEITATKVNAALRKDGERLKKKSLALLASPKTSQTLHQAIEAYKTYLLRQFVDADGETTEWGKAKTRQTDFVKQNTLDLDLVQVGEKSVTCIIDTLRKRPLTRKQKPCSESFAKSCLKELKAFLKWLDKSDQFFWTWPVGYEYKPGRVEKTPEQTDEFRSQPRRLGGERRRGKFYYYIAKRKGNKVEKRYVGRGPAALLASLEVERQSKIRKAEAQELEDYVARLWSLDRSMSLVRQAAKEALHSAYFLAGYYQTACYHWHKSNGVEMGRKRNRQQKRRRKRQNKALNSKRSNDSADANQVTPNPPDGDSQGQEAELKVDPDKWPMTINDSLRLIKSGRRDLISHLRWQLSNVPELWQRVGDISLLTIEGWARQIASGDVLLRESIMLIAKEERKQLMLDNCTLMERAVIDRFVLSKLQLQYFEFMAPHTAGELAGSKLANAICKRQSSATHQYYEAARQLAKVRELGTEISPNAPAAMAVSLKVYDPETTAERRKSA